MPHHNSDIDLFTLADDILLSGQMPDLDVLRQQKPDLPEDAQQQLEHWLNTLTHRLTPAHAKGSLHMPDFLHANLSLLWKEAVAEARQQMSQDMPFQSSAEHPVDSAQSLKELQAHNKELEGQLRQLTQQLEDQQQLMADKEAECYELNTELAAEADQRKALAQQLVNFEHQLESERNAGLQAQASFEQRLKGQQRNQLEAVAKAETEVRHYRAQLEKARDEAGRMESDLSRQVSVLDSNLAKREVQIESLRGQLHTVEEELKDTKKALHDQQQESIRLNNQLLAEVNKNKRLNDKIEVLDEQRVRAENRMHTLLNESTRRENDVRHQLQACELELQQSLSHKQALERRLITLEDEAKRLQARV